MPSYDALRDYLQSQTRDEFTLSFDEIETVLDFGLPRASHRASWWDVTRAPDEAMPQRVAIIDAGFVATRRADGAGVAFRRASLKRRWK